MLNFLRNILRIIFGTKSEKKLKEIKPLLDKINEEYKRLYSLSNDELREETNNKVIIKINLKEENDIIKTGLYVKDKINGIGTLSYIDPETKVFASLGHEILETTSFDRFRLENGSVYKAEVSSIKKSINGYVGEKKAIIDKNINYGKIEKNELEGIFGTYESELLKDELLEVGKKEEIRKGEATIKTVVESNLVKDYKINIISIDETSSNKNILFEITDKELLEQTGGIIQGMSGSPIIQNNKIIGVVNYVIIDNTKKGYGIFITTMLEEGDKILQVNN